MARAYTSFLLRRWRRGAAGQRVTVEHIQTGERATLDSLAVAFAWIRARLDAAPLAPPEREAAPVATGKEEAMRPDE